MVPDPVHSATADIDEEHPIKPLGKSMSDCVHCDIHDLLDQHLQGEEVDLTEIAVKVTEVLADLILLAAIEDRATLMADVLASLGEFVVQKGESATTQSDLRRH
jgi:hypothetical protein